MLWSSQIEDACDHLSKNKECEGDVILVAAARLAKIVVSAAEVSRRASDDHNTARHAMMAIDPLILALNNFKSSLPIEILQHCKIIIPSPLTALNYSRVDHRSHSNRPGCHLRSCALDKAYG